jgi:hypothetical protein
MAFFLTRRHAGDYDRWKPMFDEDGPGATSASTGHRLFRNADDPGEVYILRVRIGRGRARRAGAPACVERPRPVSRQIATGDRRALGACRSPMTGTPRIAIARRRMSGLPHRR